MADVGRRVRVVTWNIHGCVGRDGRYDPGRIVRHLAALKPDIVALQEVDARRCPSSCNDPFETLASAVGDHSIRAPALTGPSGQYGQLLASRWPLRDTTVHDISVDRREPRKIIEAHIDVGGARVRVLATHLGLNGRERRWQLSRLRAIAEVDRRLTTVVMGDFNDWRRRGAAHRSLEDLVGGGSGHATYPSILPLLPLDRIFWHPAEIMCGTWVVRDGRGASDHLALAADLRIG